MTIEYFVEHYGEPVIAKGVIENGYFIGAYRKNGFDYDVTMEVKFKNFEDETPEQFKPLIVLFENGETDHAYYVTWSDTVYTRKIKSKAVAWCYRFTT